MPKLALLFFKCQLEVTVLLGFSSVSQGLPMSALSIMGAFTRSVQDPQNTEAKSPTHSFIYHLSLCTISSSVSAGSLFTYYS